MDNKEVILDYLEGFITTNKAKGIISESKLSAELGIQGQIGEKKLLQGGWLLSPKNIDESSLPRFLIFTTNSVYQNVEEVKHSIKKLEQDRGWQTLATFLTKNGIGVVVAGCYSNENLINFDNLSWNHFVYQNEHLNEMTKDSPFINWLGNRGRGAKNNVPWDAKIKEVFANTDIDTLMKISIRQAFYQSYLKKQLKKPVIDPYDVDGFIVGFSGDVMPLEIKEKSVSDKGEFGIDVGRVLMLLRLCLATGNNGLYIIRELDRNQSRTLIGWRFITLANIIMGCKWNLSGGGRGMQGGSTQTIMISEKLFTPLTKNIFSEEWIQTNNNLQNSMSMSISDLINNLKKYLI